MYNLLPYGQDSGKGRVEKSTRMAALFQTGYQLPQKIVYKINLL